MSTPGLNRGGKPPPSGLHSTTHLGDAPAHIGPVGGPSQFVGALGVVRVELRVLSLSLSRWRKVFVYLW